MKYIEVVFDVPNDFREILIAELGILPFDTFEEEENTVKAYIPLNSFEKEEVNEILLRYEDLFSSSFKVVEHEDKNWNEEWENNFHPVEITKDCIIRAHFHTLEKEYSYDIVITPKMSFGTGHHETTSLMIQSEMELDFANKDVIDVGCGTGILAIMANKLGAKKVFACDIDEWAFENGKENIQLNNANNIEIQQGTIQEVNVPQSEYDIVLANINKNVLLHDMSTYQKYVKKEGILLLSGFYQQDIQDIEECAKAQGFEKKHTKEDNNWVALTFQKVK